MWHLNILAKVRIFAWRLCTNAIPTMLNINKRGIQVNPSCPLCNDGVESFVHAILRCKITSNVWRLWDDCPISLMGYSEFGHGDPAPRNLKGLGEIFWGGLEDLVQ